MGNPAGNLVTNWSLEEPYNDAGNGDRVANGWTKYILSGGLNIDSSSFERIDGDTCQQFWSDWGTFEAGIYQQIVGVKPGYWYKAYYDTAAQWFEPYPPDNMVRTIGIDPFGGIDPLSNRVSWGSSVSRNGGWATYEDGDAPVVRAVAQATTITLFIKASCLQGAHQAQAWVDAAVVLEDGIGVTYPPRAYLPVVMKGYPGGW